jgi:hypothetical protein
MADIVFTYAPADASRAHAIAEALKAYGVTAEWDRTLLPGERYDTVISKRLMDAKAVVVLWSTASIASNQIMDEASLARDQGKLVPVRIDAVEAPMGFRQLQTADLAGFPTAAAEHGVKMLAEALGQMANAPVRADAALAWRAPGPGPAPPAADDDENEPHPRLFTKGFFGWTAALSAFCGLLYFISPEGQSQMGSGVAERIETLVGTIIAPTLIFAAARIMLYWSRRWVGKPPRRYFSVEMLALLITAALLALVNTFSPSSDGPKAGTGLIGFTHQFNFAVIGVFLLFTPLILIVRGIIRLVRGAPKTA